MAGKEQSFHLIEKILMLLTGVLGLILVGMAVFGNNGIITYTQLHRNYYDMEKRVDDLSKENEKLTEEISELRDNPFYLERMAREELGMVKPGEVLYKVKPGGKK